MKKTNYYSGLTEIEINESKIKYGTNELQKQKKISFIQKIFSIFTEPMFLLLIIAASIYFILGERVDGLIMLGFVLFISGIEFIQEQKTDKALEELNTLSSLNIKVIRNGKKEIIDSKELVVGDIVILEEGDKIPADGIILEHQGLGINESSLTGESQVVYKKNKDDSNSHFKLNMCYAGCDVTNGFAIIKITSVGINTEYGKIGNDLNSISKEKTPLEKQIKKLILVCTIISSLFFIFVIIINFIYNNNLIISERIIHSILSGITVAMATIPEEIPVVLTVFLAMGAWKLAKKNTLTKNMKAVETLGAVSVLCTDKTGTLTQNKMSVQDIYSHDKNFLDILLLACPKNPYDPMEIAILDYCNKNNVQNNNYQLIHEYIFNNEDKMMGQVWEIDNKNVLCVKGAYENIAPLCSIENKTQDKIVKQIKEYASLGYRVLAIAKNTNIKEIPKKLNENLLEFVGLIALLDPPREGVKESIASCYQAGVRVIMITGDSDYTAKGIAKQIGLNHNNNVITGIELEAMNDDELKEKVKTTNIFARVYPNHKMRIVNALQENNEIVAMTGDGVNDAPALKKAEIGIAMGKRGTNVAKEAADMILMDDNFNTIVDAIKNGRSIYNNIKKALSYILVIHIPIAFSSLFVPLFHLPTLLLPIHIVLSELIIDPTSSIIFERLKPDRNVMKEDPRKINDPILNINIVIKCILQGLAIFIAFFGSYLILINKGYNNSYATTFSFSILVLSNIFVAYVLQSNEYAIKNFVKNLNDSIIVLINFIILIILLNIIYVPVFQKVVGTTSLSIKDLLLVIVISIIATFSFDILKIRNIK